MGSLKGIYSMKSIEISVQITPIEMGFLRATSPELRGLYSASKRLDDLLSDVRQGIADLLAEDGDSYNVSKPEKLGENSYLFRAECAGRFKRAS